MKNIDTVHQQFQLAIKNGDPSIEKLRVVIVYKDNPCTYMYTIFDFYDNYNKIKQNTIEKFYIYQLFNEVK